MLWVIDVAVHSLFEHFLNVLHSFFWISLIIYMDEDVHVHLKAPMFWKDADVTWILFEMMSLFQYAEPEVFIAMPALIPHSTYHILRTTTSATIMLRPPPTHPPITTPPAEVVVDPTRGPSRWTRRGVWRCWGVQFRDHCAWFVAHGLFETQVSLKISQDSLSEIAQTLALQQCYDEIPIRHGIEHPRCEWLAIRGWWCHWNQIFSITSESMFLKGFFGIVEFITPNLEHWFSRNLSIKPFGAEDAYFLAFEWWHSTRNCAIHGSWWTIVQKHVLFDPRVKMLNFTSMFLQPP